MSSKKENPLSKVQNLYLMQVELWNFLDDASTDAQKVQHAKKTLKEFQALLGEVDWQHMGGEDVLQSLQRIPTEVSQKLKSAPASKRFSAKKVAVKKSVKKIVAKKNVKKAASKKKVVTKKTASKKKAGKKKQR